MAFGSLVRSPPRKGKETTATQAIFFFVFSFSVKKPLIINIFQVKNRKNNARVCRKMLEK